MGPSKLAWLSTLKTSKVYFNETRSVMGVTFTSEMSARFCQAWRKMLRWPVVKLVSKVSPGGIAPPRSPGFRSGRVKQLALSAYADEGAPGRLAYAPEAPVTALFGVHPGASGTMGLVIPSLTP